MKFKGVALEPHAETHGTSGLKKRWPAAELRKAADTLEGKPITRDSSSQHGGWSGGDVVGEVTDAWYEDGRGVVYEAEIYDDEMALRLETDVARIAPRLVHDQSDESTDDLYVVEDVQFEGLFLCPAVSDGVPGIGEWTVVT